MKKIISILLISLLALGLVACGDTSQNKRVDENPAVEESNKSTEETNKENLQEDITSEENKLNEQESVISSSEECSMKLLINEKEIPVIWENNDSVNEIKEEATKGDITVSMSMYSDNEQVGSLGKSYTRNDKQTTTHNGDIVLYSGSNIVLFYGSNSWAYTRLGKMDLSEAEVTELLSNGDVSVRLTSTQN